MTLLQRSGLAGTWAAGDECAGVSPYMMRDKKVLAGEMRLVLPLAIGNSEVARRSVA